VVGGGGAATNTRGGTIEPQEKQKKTLKYWACLL
jgi:hypothetical protein